LTKLGENPTNWCGVVLAKQPSRVVLAFSVFQEHKNGLGKWQ